MKKKTILSLLLAVLSISGAFQAAKLLTVTRVIDSVTLELSNGEKVRLIGVENPNKLEQGNKAAEKFIREIAKGKSVRLEYDVQRKDKDGRTLAYVYLKVPATTRFDDKNLTIEEKYSETFLNGALVGAGYAQAMFSTPNVKYQELFAKLEKEAKTAKRGLWK